ncbi:glycosyltransferase family 2 protein [Loktanella sp. Alg231-35]|uniref:glycosyltransferase family 2 protein n=1 Tax=Loktanella sp. Alg231-35 TaxID=1922220 RepID=UPI000D55D10E|nr:glycosyltransferase family 2 protein [Loktanella sp. Alg231-35]
MLDDKTSGVAAAADKSAQGSLNWTLCIPTYNRPQFLTQTIGFALSQSRPPSEVVVVDGSDNWAEHRDLVLGQFAEDWQTVRLVYEEAKVRSVTFQRNQALGAATSDIVFFLDDDIYLYPDAAEIVMGIYETDKDDLIAMVAGKFTEGPYDPDAPTSTEVATPAPAPQALSIRGRFRHWLEEFLTLDGHFVTYGPPVDRSPLPDPIRAAGASEGGLINGGRTTFRRKFGVQVGWSEMLKYYAPHDDSDLSYRMSRLGRLVHATNAGFFHADGNDSNVGRFRANTIRVRNLMSLHRVHSDKRLSSALRLIGSFAKFMALYCLIDPVRKRWTLPTVRAYGFGILQVPFFLFWPFADFQTWYTGLQEKMYGNRYKS